jgi:hypothetical protein
MKAIGFVLAISLVLSLFSGSVFAEPKNDNQYNTKTKTSIKKDIRDLKVPHQDKTVKITTITKSRMLTILYIVGVEACAGKERLYSPEIVIKSDRESMTVKVAGLIMPKTCKNGEFFIRANDPSSISVEFSKGGYNPRST